MTALLQPESRASFAQYEEMLAASDVKLEFRDGEVVAMAGGSETHSLVSTNAARQLGNQLSNFPCRVYNSDMKVRVEATQQAFFPDASVVCDPSKFTDLHRRSLLNPCLIAEVLSESTAAYDRGKKFWHYRHLESLHTYLLISTDEALVEVYERMDGGDWRLRTYDGLEAEIRLEHLELCIPVAGLYAKTSLDGAAASIPLSTLPQA